MVLAINFWIAIGPRSTQQEPIYKQQGKKNYPIEDLFRVLGDRGTEEAHSARFILGPTYGTCASTVVKLHSKGFHFEERCYAPNGEQASGNAFVSD